jgi:hypothetical protein
MELKTMNKYAVMIEVDDELMYVSADNPFSYKSKPVVFDTEEEAKLAASTWKTGRVVPYHAWDNWHEGPPT